MFNWIISFIVLVSPVIGESVKDATNSIEPSAPTSPFEALYMSFSMILISEIGDKTFLLAALMAMKHPRMIVFTASASALILMTFLSGLLGEILPSLLSPKVSQLSAAVLFLAFSISLLREGLSMDKNQGVEDEMNEIKEEVAAKEINQVANTLEEGRSIQPHEIESEENEEKSLLDKIKSLVKSIISSVWIQTFVMTIVGEWGDRSQISTIAMAAGSDYSMVVVGGSIGHILCSLIAVIGGQLIASKISMRTVVLSGSVTFALFSCWYLYCGLTAN